MKINVDKRVAERMRDCGYNVGGQCRRKCVSCKKGICTECIKKPKYKCTAKCSIITEYKKDLEYFKDKLEKGGD